MMKISAKENIRELNVMNELALKVLEKVVGGATIDKMTQEEIEEYYRLENAVSDAFEAGDYDLGYKLEDEYDAFVSKMVDKYGY